MRKLRRFLVVLTMIVGCLPLVALAAEPASLKYTSLSRKFTLDLPSSLFEIIAEQQEELRNDMVVPEEVAFAHNTDQMSEYYVVDWYTLSASSPIETSEVVQRFANGMVLPNELTRQTYCEKMMVHQFIGARCQVNLTTDNINGILNITGIRYNHGLLVAAVFVAASGEVVAVLPEQRYHNLLKSIMVSE